MNRLAALALLLLLSTTGAAGDVIGVDVQQLDPQFWLTRTADADRVILDAAGIRAFNSRATASDPNLVDLASLPTEIDGETLRRRITALSQPPAYPLYVADGRAVNEADWMRWQDSLHLDALDAANALRFGLAIRRSSLRRYPTDERVLRDSADTDIDRFQESAHFPGDAVAVLHSSRDGQWLFVQSYNYAAWLRSVDLALGSREMVLGYHMAADQLVVTGSRAYTNYNPEQRALSELQLDMGTRLPLLPVGTYGNSVYGQNPYASFVINLPLRSPEGALRFAPALVARSQDVHVGALPFSRAAVIRQAFKFLGERYGWGHDYNGRDCTGFISEVYKSMGILLPRNSGDQGLSDVGHNTRFAADATRQDRLAALAGLDVGDLIYIPGHVMMFVGTIDAQPFVIHDVTGIAYRDQSGDLYQGVLNGVSLTPLLPLQASGESSYVDMIYTIKKIR